LAQELGCDRTWLGPFLGDRAGRASPRRDRGHSRGREYARAGERGSPRRSSSRADRSLRSGGWPCRDSGSDAPPASSC
jgi:hypothetical protein